jgi:hypothetical protein
MRTTIVSLLTVIGALCVVATSTAGCGGDITGTPMGMGGMGGTSTSSSSKGMGGSHGPGGVGGTGGAAAPACPSYMGAGCKPGDTMEVPYCVGEPSSSGGVAMCLLEQGCTTAWDKSCEPTPLVLSFDGAPVAYRRDHERAFDLGGARGLATDWPTAATPWLALDRDGSGAIEDGSELFGSMTPLPCGRRAVNGFDALRALDTNGDGQITRADADFSRLVVWSDRDGDRRSSPGELATLASLGVVSIDLAYTEERRCDVRGNCEVERAKFRFVGSDGAEHVGAIVDVHLAGRLF